LKSILKFQLSSGSCEARSVIYSPVTRSPEIMAFWAMDVKGNSKESAGVGDLGTNAIVFLFGRGHVVAPQ